MVLPSITMMIIDSQVVAEDKYNIRQLRPDGRYQGAAGRFSHSSTG
jgi:hypothetical protein